MMEIKSKIVSSDKSIKYKLETDDNKLFESIYMPHDDGVVLCLSSQIGCVNKCTHCATGKVDFERDLTASEIYNSAKIMIEDNNCEEGVTVAILFMGMGEPFLNYQNVLAAIDMFCEKMGIQEENITISTVGIVKRIEDFARLKRRIRLAVSIHATNNLQRDRMIPLNKIYDLESILGAVSLYNSMKLRQVLFQYTLIGGVNDRDIDAVELAKMAHEYKAEVRLIPFNPSKSIAFETTTNERIESFCCELEKMNVDYVVSRSRGIDVSGGCGQLYLKEEGD